MATVAVPGDEARWIIRGKAETVRSLKVTAKAPPEPDEEEWVNLCAEVSPEKWPSLDEGLRVSGVVIGATATKMQRVNTWAEEFHSTHPAPADEHEDDVLFASEDDFESLKERLEQENRQWAGLAAVDPLKAPQSGGELDPWRIYAELKGLVGKRNRWDEVFGHVAMLFKKGRAWEPLGFASFGHYCEERLGMAERTVAQRVALELNLNRMPLLRQALREKRISYEKARVIARHAEGEEVQGWVEKGEAMTCVDLRRAMQDKREGQMCARGTFSVCMPVSVAEVVKATFRAARAAAKRWLSAGDCLVALAEHFVETWSARRARPRIRRARRPRSESRPCAA